MHFIPEMLCCWMEFECGPEVAESHESHEVVYNQSLTTRTIVCGALRQLVRLSFAFHLAMGFCILGLDYTASKDECERVIRNPGGQPAEQIRQWKIDKVGQVALGL